LWIQLLLLLAVGGLLFLWRLNAVGQVDETPALFAAAGRAMAETGDWITPRVNGHPRFDKPVLIYWLIGLATAGLPATADPLGSLAACLPSALATMAVMVALAVTASFDRGAAATAPLAAGLAFALSPLVLVWGRVSVSDPLLTACVALALLGFWRAYANPHSRRPWFAWLALGLAVLTKGPVGLLLVLLVLLGFAWLQRDGGGLARAIHPGPGLALTLAVALPWYLIVWQREGAAFVQSFFGYHNLQRFTQVVNHHAGPWWFYLPVLVLASFPFVPLLLLGLTCGARGLPRRLPLRAAESLPRFALCWLVVVLVFFSLSATKLPSYLLPGLPAMALLVALADGPPPLLRFGRLGTLLLMVLLGVVLLASPAWLPLVRDPEMPGLAAELIASGLVARAGGVILLAAAMGGLRLLQSPLPRAWLPSLQLPLVLLGPWVLVPLAVRADRLRQAPVRDIAAAVRQLQRPAEPLAMAGINKPSLHYYSRQVVHYAGQPASGVRDLGEQLGIRQGPRDPSPTLLLVIDAGTAALPHWRAVPHRDLARAGMYRLWRVERQSLADLSRVLARGGVPSTWRTPNPERY
jgi:4-amino-4-deoxy-L-arabinose transferase-like glycosyltransferase